MSQVSGSVTNLQNSSEASDASTAKMDWISLALLILVAVASRFIPHPPNFTAVGAVALLGGYLFRRLDLRLAMVIPMVAMFISDLFLGFHPVMLFVYIGMMLATVVGFALRKQKALWLILGALSSSVIFFALSNLGVWLVAGYYEQTWAGLVQCFAMAIPFFKNQLAGDVVWTAGLYAVHQAAQRFSTVGAAASAPSTN